MALLMSLISVVPLFSATSGTIDILDSADGDEISWTNSSATIWVHVEDADLDLPIKAVMVTADDPDDFPGCTDAEDVTAQIAGTGSQYVTLTNIPVLDSGVSNLAKRLDGETDSFVNKKDVVILDADGVVYADWHPVGTSGGGAQVLSMSADGLITLDVTTVPAGWGTGGNVYAVYWGSGVNDTGSDAVTGTHDGLDDAAVLSDSTADFVNSGVQNGDEVTNVTDGSSCTITGVTATTVTCTLGGGTDNDWDDGDAYSIGDEGTPLVNAKSSQDETGIWLNLEETNATSGVFEAGLDLCTADDCSADNSRLWVGADDVVTLTYTDEDPSRTARTTVTVESTAPAFSNFSPEDGYATSSNRPTFGGNVTDADSGVLEDEDVALTIRFMFRLTDLDGDLLGTYYNDDVDPDDTGTVAAMTGGFAATQRLTSDLVATEDVYLVQWWMKAEDAAGNVGISDLDPDTDDCDSASFDITGNDMAIHGCQPYEVRIDFEDPALDSATTGNWWDVENTVVAFGADGVNTSIEVVFTEGLDGTSVAVTDFDSDDVDIQAASWYSDKPESVFLTTKAMKADLEPTIDVVGSIKDKAGNAMTTGSVDVDDGIPATLEVKVTGTHASQPVTDETITIEVKSDEALTSTPDVVVKKVLAGWVPTGTDLAGAASLVGTRTWKVEVDFTAANAGLYNVYVTGIDLGGLITASTGVTGVSVEDDEDAILFEVDTGIPDPAFTPADEGETDNPDAFIIVTFTNEGKEYGLTAGDVFTTTPANVATSFDTHDTVTITDATLDGDAITFATRDDIVFLVRPGGLELGEHTVAITVEDEAGNEDEFEATFEVTEKAAYELPVQPGMNLLSLPGSPVSTGINDVLGDVDAIDLVVTYAPADPAGPWLTAQRNATTGLLEGTLTAIDGQHAYWMRSDTFVDVEVYIAEVGYQELPPTILVVKGWNLVPVTDVGLSDAGTAIAADNYLTSIGWTVGWSFDTLTDSWQRISYLGGDNVAVGMGYWIWATATGTIVP
jgi:hypothetical protein